MSQSFNKPIDKLENIMDTVKRVNRTILGLVNGNDPILFQSAKKVSRQYIDEGDCDALVEDMWATMFTRGGIGLAAPQVGVSLRIVVVSVQGFTATLINPQIIKASSQMATSKEGCLSYPGKTVLVPRHKRITLRYTSVDGEESTIKLSALASYCIQHEVDHLNGVTIGGKQGDK